MKLRNLILILILILIFAKITIGDIPPPPPPIFDLGEKETCSDGIKNQDETDIDCGGICRACKNGQDCNINDDCKSNSCENRVCVKKDTIPPPPPPSFDDKSSFNVDESSSTISLANYVLLKWLLIILIILVILFTILIIAGGIIIFYFLKKNKNIKKEGLQSLKNYIKINLNKGYSYISIKKSLLQQGWPEDEINQAFNEIKWS